MKTRLEGRIEARERETEAVAKWGGVVDVARRVWSSEELGSAFSRVWGLESIFSGDTRFK